MSQEYYTNAGDKNCQKWET